MADDLHCIRTVGDFLSQHPWRTRRASAALSRYDIRSEFAPSFSGNKPMPMIAVRDIGVRAAELLAPEVGPRVKELHGACDYTMEEAVSILGAAIGLPNARYIQFSYEERRAGVIPWGWRPDARRRPSAHAVGAGTADDS